MEANSQRQKRQDNALSMLDMAIEAVNLAKDASSVTPAQVVFSSVSVLLTMIRDSVANKSDYVELGLACADVCKALHRGMNGKKPSDLSPCVGEAIEQLMKTVKEIQENVAGKSRRNLLSRIFHAKNDKQTIAAWKLDLNRILHVFNIELVVNIQVTISDMNRNVSMIQEEIGGQSRLVQTSALGESPPPPPRACFGRDDLIAKVIDLAENLTPLALIGPGGIGKTSIGLTVLHHDRVKKRFGDNRRFIRCDQFPASRTYFLSQLSKVIGAGVENPEDLTPLRPFLSSREMILFLDNVESVLDPRGTNAREIYAVVEELSRINNVCICLTSRITVIPSDFKRLGVPTLSMDAACLTFYRIYDSNERSCLVNNILERLDFHPLSVTLLATVAHHNMWDADRLTKEWESRRTDVLYTQHENSLAATIELSLASPMFRDLGPDARGLLGVVAFFPQGVDEKNLDWLFPTLSNRAKTFDNFCVLSLTYRSNGFITMLAPLRDYLRPEDPTSSPLLHTTMEHYFSRVSVFVNPGDPGFEEARWIRSEDVNVEHLLDVLTSVDIDSVDAWDTCACFMRHLYWHKARLVVLGPKIEGLPDDHPSKPQCLFQLSRLFESVGNYVEYKRLLIDTLELWKERGNGPRVAQTLKFISGANRLLGLHKEGMEKAKEASEIYEQLNDVPGQVRSWHYLASSLYSDKQFDAAEEVALRVIGLLSDEGEQYPVCDCHRLLGDVYHSKGETEKAVSHYETALEIAKTFNWRDHLFWNNYSLAKLFFDENMFDAAHTHIERAKSHAANGSYFMGHAMELQARFWYKEGRFEEAKCEALRAAEIYEGIGATDDVEDCKVILQNIELKVRALVASG